MTAAEGRRNPWDRQPNETNPAWEAFKAYRDMGLGRSTAKVQREIGKSKRLVDGWSSKNVWVARAAAWDAEQDRHWQAELREAQRELAKSNLKVARAAMGAAGRGLAGIVNDSVHLKPTEVARLIESSTRLQQFVFAGASLAAPASEEVLDEVDLQALSDEEIAHHMLTLRKEIDADLARYPDLVDDAGAELIADPYRGDD